MKSKLYSLVSYVICAALIFSGCSSNKTNQGASSNKDDKNNSIVTAAGSFPIVKDKLTFKIMFPQIPQIIDIDKNEMTKHMEEKTNIHVDWQLVPQKDMSQKINLILASNSELPDIFMNCGISQSIIVKYAAQKMFIPLNSYIDKYGIEFKTMEKNTKFKNLRQLITAPDGNIYGVPSINECYNCEWSQRMWINDNWMKKLGLKMPETTDEFYNVLKAFRDNDPNGNGKKDEVALIGSGSTASIEGYIMSSFIYDDGINRFNVNDGKIDVPYNKPEWKEGLQYLNKLSKEKLLDNTSFTLDGEQLKQLVEKKDAELVGAVISAYPNGFANVNGDRIKNYSAVGPLKGPKGFKSAGYYPSYPQIGKFVVTSSCKYPDAAYRWADYLLSEEMSIWTRWGVPDKDWTKAKEGEIGVDGRPGYLKPILAWGSNQNSHWQQGSPFFCPDKYTLGQVLDKSTWSQPPVLYNATKDKYQGFEPKEVLPPLFMTEKENDEYAELSLTVNNYLNENIARFVLGDRDIEKEWDKYTKELNDMGLDKYIKLVQQAYDRQFKTKK